jgi:hypothetical protein
MTRGTTQKEADENLANLSKDLANVETSQQSFTLVYNSHILINNPYQIKVKIKLSANAKLELDLTTSNGIVTVSNVNGGSVTIHTSNGLST